VFWSQVDLGLIHILFGNTLAKLIKEADLSFLICNMGVDDKFLGRLCEGERLCI